MSIRGGKTRGLQRPQSALGPTTGDDSRGIQDVRTAHAPQPGYRPLLPHEQGYSEFDTPGAAAIVMGLPHPYRPTESPLGNPYVYGPPEGCLEHTITDDDAHVEQQASPVEGHDVDNGADPEDIPHHESEDVTQPPSEDRAQSEGPALPVLKENEVWTIGIFTPINMLMNIYIYMCVCVCVCM